MNDEQKAKARERAKKYYQKNKEKILAKQKEYHRIRYKNDEEYRKKCNEKSRKYREANPEKVKEIKRKSFKKYYQEHKEYYKNYNKKYSEKYGYHWYKNKLEDYKSRIDKAIEYIKNHTIEWVDEQFEAHNVMVDVDEYFNPEHLIWLLNGGDEK